MDKSTRNDIQRATQAARGLLEVAFSEQLEGTYDILLDGTISDQPGSHLSDRQKVTREKLVAAVAHKRATGLNAKEAVNSYLREAAFTTLNRFVALKMLEARQLVQECVSKGEDSSGFKEFTALAPGLVTIEDKGYRLYIETLFDEIGQEVKVLFDRRDVASLLWPDRQTLLELVGILNGPGIAEIWDEDETIGWVYQYFNGDEERTQMRAESQAPRNSRELAVRNQFFTPRYVVQFLTDNTLGRIWYEMMQGKTDLAHLDYLVLRPNEVFLAEDASDPESEADDSEFSQEELLLQTVYVPFRAKKDPRDLRILDPACGSGHFLLYAFDLLISVYEEAWCDAEAADFTVTDTTLRADYGSIKELRLAMPELILRHNLHGVDIDPRAAQIAALALWMRAQRAHNQFDVDRDQRPPITKTNIVVAEPMPGDADLVEEFAARLKPAVLGDLFKKMVEEMKVAGELGSLLKIEELTAKAVKDAEEAHLQGSLFAGKIESQEFWDTIDEEIVAALGSFAESAAGGAGIRRRLFAGDAAEGVAFIELMRKKFDVSLMNPPFGRPSVPSRNTLQSSYPFCWRDVYGAFVLRGVELLTNRGFLGAITSRTGLFLSSFEQWRKEVLLAQSAGLIADFYYGVLDGAMVETAAYTLERMHRGDTEHHVTVFDLTEASDKKLGLLTMCAGEDRTNRYSVKVSDLQAVPGAPFSYSAAPELRALFARYPKLSSQVENVCVGPDTGDDEAFVRAIWEVPAQEIGLERRWTPLAKGGGYAEYFSEVHLVIERRRPLRRAGNPEFYGIPGITFPSTSMKGFSARLLPAGCIVGHKSPGIFFSPFSLERCLQLLAYLNSDTFRDLLRMLTPGRSFEVGYVGNVPVPDAVWETDAAHVGEAVLQAREEYRAEETSLLFLAPSILEEGSEATEWDCEGERVPATLSWLTGVALGRWSSDPEAYSKPVDRLTTLSSLIEPPSLPLSLVTDGPSIILEDDVGSKRDINMALVDASQRLQLSSDLVRSLASEAAIRSWLAEEFFAFHIKQYSKSRRKAPIYWQLATPTATYSVWCYYHRLTRDTFFRVANDYVTPKVDHEERKLTALRQEVGLDPSSTQRKAIDAQESFVAELRAFATEVTRIAPLWNPNLNDGVIINFAPLWRLVPQHKPWQKECKKVWDKLVKGDYDWAHLALHLWPERVVPKCADDRSLAIAHGLEDAFWYEDDKEKWQKRQVTEDRVESLIADRSSTTVKAALKDLLESPAPAAGRR